MPGCEGMDEYGDNKLPAEVATKIKWLLATSDTNAPHVNIVCLPGECNGRVFPLGYWAGTVPRHVLKQ